MMASDCLQLLRGLGFTLKREGDGLLLTGPVGDDVDALSAFALEHKPGLLALLDVERGVGDRILTLDYVRSKVVTS